MTNKDQKARCRESARSSAGSLLRLLFVGLQLKEIVMSTRCNKLRRPFRHQMSLEDLLADDMIQSMMRADGISPTMLRTLFRELEERSKAWTANPARHRLRALFGRVFNRLLSSEPACL